VALTSGQFDFVVSVRAPDVRALRDVVLYRLAAMRPVRSTQTIFVLEEEHHDLPVTFDAGPHPVRRRR
jgi:DNA-binding Lrp family transcriptional regulator